MCLFSSLHIQVNAPLEKRRKKKMSRRRASRLEKLRQNLLVYSKTSLCSGSFLAIMCDWVSGWWHMPLPPPEITGPYTPSCLTLSWCKKQLMFSHKWAIRPVLMWVHTTAVPEQKLYVILHQQGWRENKQGHKTATLFVNLVKKNQKVNSAITKKIIKSHIAAFLMLMNQFLMKLLSCSLLIQFFFIS